MGPDKRRKLQKEDDPKKNMTSLRRQPQKVDDVKKDTL